MKRKLVLLSSWLAFSLLLGCAAPPPAATPTPAPLTSTPIPSAAPTDVPAPPTLTLTPSPTPMKTLTSSPTNTPAVEGSPTWTPLPTIAVPHHFIDSLMQDNAGCRLPCWWGIVPGESSWESTRHLLERFTGIERAGYDFGEENSQSYIAFFFNPGQGENSTTAFFNIQGDVVQIMSIGKEATQYSFLLHQLLADYGKPDAILFGNHGAGYQYQAYSLVLVYYEQRILADFLFEVDTAAQPLETCIAVSPVLLVWSDSLMWTEEQALANIPTYSNMQERPLPSLEETTDMDVQTFYELFKNPDIEPCLEIK